VFRTNNRDFVAVNERLRGYPRAQTMAEIQRSGRRYPNQGGDPYPNGDRTGYGNPPSGRVDYPSSRFRNYSVLNVAQVSVPENWREVSDSGQLDLVCAGRGPTARQTGSPSLLTASISESSNLTAESAAGDE
jgi:hypothetical protein